MRTLLLLLLLFPPLSSFAAEYVPGELLVRFKPRAAVGPLQAEERKALHARLGSILKKRLSALDIDHVRLGPGLDPLHAAALYLKDPLVASAEPNYMYHALGLNSPNDHFYTACSYSADCQWSYGQIQADKAYDAWANSAIAFKADVIVAVVDTGVRASHKDLSGTVLSGWNFITGNANSSDDEILGGHGTFIASLIAAHTNDLAAGPSYGIAGVAFTRVKILPVKVLDLHGQGELSDIAQGVLYAADQGARVVNLSLGSDAKADTLESALNYAWNKGSLPVAATGNENAGVFYPAAYPQALAVGALDRAGNRAGYSNYGRVQISAPGGAGSVAVPGVNTGLSPVPTTTPAGMNTEILGASNLGDTFYGTGAGTSFAAPLVSGAAALLFAQEPARSPMDVTAILENTADPTTLGAGFHSETGWGRLNVYRALTNTNAQTNVLGGGLKVYNWPNPFNPDKEGGTQLTFILERPVDATLRIYDAAGEPLFEKKLDAGQTHAGLNYVRWNGKTGTGAAAANGAYLFTVEADGKKGKNRIAVLK